MKFVAFYLPQFHEFEENNKFWGKGFTEWTNVKKSESYFWAHKQPKIPSVLGYYDLSNDKQVESQIKLAKEFGIDVFAVYIYWFNEKSIMDKPLESIFKYAKIYDLKIFFIWANENWTRRWDGGNDEILIQQNYSIEKDVEIVNHYRQFFDSDTYFKIDGKLMFGIYRPDIIPRTTDFLLEIRKEFNKFSNDVHLTMVQSFNNFDPRVHQMDSAIQFPPHQIKSRSHRKPLRFEDSDVSIYSYQDYLINSINNLGIDFINFPGTMVAWDNTPRKGSAGDIVSGSEAIHFYHWLIRAGTYSISTLPNNFQLVFINAWNEWAEGAYLEPDLDSGFSKLYAVKLAKKQLDTFHKYSNEIDKYPTKYNRVSSFLMGENIGY